VVSGDRREFESWSQARDELASRLVALSDGGQSAIALIDGRSGSGKTTFAKELADAVFATGESAARVVHMDDLYPGWDGLRAGSLYLVQHILGPLARGQTASWQLWNWARSERGRSGEVGNGWREFGGGTPLIIEGCGSISRASVELAQITLWVEAELPVRRARWKQRDGDRFAQHWTRWAVQEDEFYQDEHSRQLAKFELAN
jgi:energy-coupling factor transporter ATP-binding protein EcfA2